MLKGFRRFREKLIAHLGLVEIFLIYLVQILHLIKRSSWSNNLKFAFPLTPSDTDASKRWGSLQIVFQNLVNEGVSCNQSNSLSFVFAKPANFDLVLTERAHSRIHYE